MAAALHFDLSVHNFGIQEYMRHSDETDRVFPHGYTFADGMLHPGERPGLGVGEEISLSASLPACEPESRRRDAQLVKPGILYKLCNDDGASAFDLSDFCQVTVICS